MSGRHRVHRAGKPDRQLQQALHPRPQDGHQVYLRNLRKPSFEALAPGCTPTRPPRPSGGARRRSLSARRAGSLASGSAGPSASATHTATSRPWTSTWAGTVLHCTALYCTVLHCNVMYVGRDADESELKTLLRKFFTCGGSLRSEVQFFYFYIYLRYTQDTRAWFLT